MPAGALDLLAVVEALCRHFEERHTDVMRWSWKLFCAKWVRLLEAGRARKIEERTRERKREDETAFAHLARVHREQHGV